MADAITIKALQDASLDAKSLEEVVNGSETKQVTTRLGETYPSVKKAIKTLFENGGLPATPFKTKALMTASSLPNDSYAVVTNDADDAENLVYVKTAGVWVKTKYNSIDIIKNSVLVDYKKNSTDKVFTPVNFKTGFLLKKLDGSESADALWKVSGDYIAVSKGDYIVIENAGTITGGTQYESFSQVALYDSGQVFDSTLFAINIGNRNGYYKSLDEKLAVSLGMYNANNEGDNIAVKVPRNGFIKIAVPVQANPKVYKVAKDEFLNSACIQAPKEMMSDFLNKAEMIEIDNTKLGSRLADVQVTGNPVAYTASTVTLVSKKIAISEGEYLNLHMYQNIEPKHNYVFEDASGVVLGMSAAFDEYSTTDNGGVMIANIRSPFTGFVRINFTNNTCVPQMYSVSASKQIETPRLIPSNGVIKFYEGGSSSVTMQDVGSRAVNGYFWRDIKSSRRSGMIFSRSIPYLLKKGEVLEYSLDSTISHVLGFVIPAKRYTNAQLEASHLLAPLLDTSIYTLAEGLDNVASPSPVDFYGAKGRSATGYYCNDDEDVVVIFNRPCKTHSAYSSFSLSESYRVTVLSKDAYKAKRDSFLAARLKSLTKYVVTGTTAVDIKPNNALMHNNTSYPNILIFKDEVFDCLVANNMRYVGIQLIAPDEQAAGVKIVDVDRLFSTMPAIINAPIPIDLDDPRSCRNAQFIAKKTCNVIIGFISQNPANIQESLDYKQVISDGKYRASIIDFKDAKGDKLKSSKVYGLSHFVNTEGHIDTAGYGARNSLAAYVPAGSYISFSMLSTNNLLASYVVQMRDADGKYRRTGGTVHTPLLTATSYKPLMPKLFKGTGEVPDVGKRWVASEYDIVESGIFIKEDCLVVLLENSAVSDVNVYKNSDTGFDYSSIYTKTPVSLIDAVNQEYAIISNNYKGMYLKGTDKQFYEENYLVTKDTFLSIPNPDALSFNFLEPVSKELELSSWGIMQIKKSGKIIAVLYARTQNQGQSSAAWAKKNINVEMYNSAGKSFTIKFGDKPEEDEVVLKSYYESDMNMLKDSTSADLWYDIRNYYDDRIGGAFPDDVYSDLSKPSNQVARGTTFGYPVEVHKGGGFHSLSCIRTKKKGHNYCVESGNRNHILMQADWTLLGALSFATLQLGNFEVRNPKMAGYIVGAATLPAAYADVETNTLRFINYLKDTFNGTVSLRDTYQDYINLDSFIDYVIHANVVGNWDGLYNNFLVGTYDSNIWNIFAYDMDNTFGAAGFGAPLSPTVITTTTVTWFGVFQNTFRTEIESRYAYLRNSGLIETKAIRNRLKDYDHMISVDAKLKDAAYWRPLKETAGVPYISDWLNKKQVFLDSYYNFVA